MPRRTRRRLVARALLRPAATAGGLGILYYQLPLGAQWSRGTAAGFLLGLLALVALIVWQARSIATAAYPRVRAIEALATTIAYFVFLFSAAYFIVASSQPAAFNETLTRTDSLYFTVTVFTSVGFGDIVAVTEGARVMVILQMLGSLALLGAGARVLLSAVQAGLRHTRDSGT